MSHPIGTRTEFPWSLHCFSDHSDWGDVCEWEWTPPPSAHSRVFWTPQWRECHLFNLAIALGIQLHVPTLVTQIISHDFTENRRRKWMCEYMHGDKSYFLLTVGRLFGGKRWMRTAVLHHIMHPIPTRILVTTPHSSARSETKSLRVDTGSLSLAS